MKLLIGLGVPMAVVGGVLVLSWGALRTAPQVEQSTVSIVTPELRDLVEAYRNDCRILPEQRMIYAPEDGEIRLEVQAGEPVAPDQPLFRYRSDAIDQEIASRLARLRLLERKGQFRDEIATPNALSILESEITDSRDRAATLTGQIDKAEALHRAGELASEALAEMRSAVSQSQASLRQLEARLQERRIEAELAREEARLERDQIEGQLQRLRGLQDVPVTAALAGAVAWIAEKLDAGGTAPGQWTPVMKGEPALAIATGAVDAVIERIPDAIAGRLAAGAPVSVEQSFMQALGTASVRRVERVQGATHFRLRARLLEATAATDEAQHSGRKSRWLLGGRGQCTVRLSQVKQALSLPYAAVELDATGPYVNLIDRDGTAVRRPITLGINDDRYVEIRGGLSRADKVVERR